MNLEAAAAGVALVIVASLPWIMAWLIRRIDGVIREAARPRRPGIAYTWDREGHVQFVLTNRDDGPRRAPPPQGRPPLPYVEPFGPKPLEQR